jgi:hypothetical protein
MPLTSKGKKLKKKFREQYGKKKGDSVFYAMENSGKLKKVIKARGGDAAKSDQASGRSAGRADPGGGVDRSAVGAGSQFAKNRARQNLAQQRKQTIKAISPSTTIGGQALKYGLMFSGIPFAGKITSGILDRGQNLGYGKQTKKTNVTRERDSAGEQNRVAQKIIPIQATKPIDTNLIKPKDNFFNFVSYKIGGLSGGVSYGPPPKRGPNPQVPPVKMKKGGHK